jgi:glutamate racemase
VSDSLRTASSPVGIFDSGVGGLSVLREIKARFPNEALLYVADSGFAPYGERSVGYIEQRSAAITDFLLAQGAKAIVVACNTATAAIVPVLRQRVSVPVVAIEPAVKPAAGLSRSGVIGVLATRQTLISERFSKLITAHAASVEVVTEACPDLVELVERGCTGGSDAEASIEHHLRALLQRRADVVVLGCTHFHFLRTLVESIAGPTIHVVDPGIPVALELGRRLARVHLLCDIERRPSERFWTSGDLDHSRRVIPALLARPCDVEALPPDYCRRPIASA